MKIEDIDEIVKHEVGDEFLKIELINVNKIEKPDCFAISGDCIYPCMVVLKRVAIESGNYITYVEKRVKITKAIEKELIKMGYTLN